MTSSAVAFRSILILRIRILLSLSILCWSYGIIIFDDKSLSTDNTSSYFTCNIIVINLRRRSERLTHVTTQLNNLSLQFYKYAAIDGLVIRKHFQKFNPHKNRLFIPISLHKHTKLLWHKLKIAVENGIIGFIHLANRISHIQVLFSIVDNNKNVTGLEKPVLILEDDVVVERHFPDIVNKLLPMLPSSWEIFDIGTTSSGSCIPDTTRMIGDYGYCQSNGNIPSTHAYIVRNSAVARKLLKVGNTETLRSPDPEPFWSHMISRGNLTCFIITPRPLIGQEKAFESDLFGAITKSHHRLPDFNPIDPVLRNSEEYVLNVSSSINITRDISRLYLSNCVRKYGQRTYLPEGKLRNPVVLYAFQGSGNHLCRSLIEWSTGMLTGSIFDSDMEIVKSFPGEVSCDHTVIAVLAHPFWVPARDMFTSNVWSMKGKCKHGYGTVKGFTRAVLQIRNPYDTIWSEFQRIMTTSHVGLVSSIDFDWSNWATKALQLAYLYNDMLRVQYATILRTFKSEDVIMVRFEDLLDKGRRTEEVVKLVQFLGIEKDMDRIHCAFTFSEHGKTHRSSDASQVMTKQVAYTKELSCEMWEIFGSLAILYGYHIFGGYDCRTAGPLPVEWNVTLTKPLYCTTTREPHTRLSASKKGGC
mmetsp:Transcript_21322/g.21451  ORF Transcript_21322/g.21451 Transcript_21322/m.21451 type:complete len:642 (-) Transcript_21322:178-2103(-)